MGYNASRMAFERMRAEAGYQWVCFHDLRQEAISRLLEIGLAFPEATSVNGHRTSSILARYAHPDPVKVS